MVGGRVGSGSTCKIEIDYEVCSHFFHTDNANILPFSRHAMG